jgi:adenosylmethionine-8-amino-7-oxononanoate aminotransferase
MRYDDHVLYRDLYMEYPLIVRGEGVYLYDSDGRRYLDAIGGANVADIGHGVEAVAEAMASQAKQIAFVHGSRFRSQPLVEFAHLVAAMAPSGMTKVYVTPGGTEAIESSMKIVRLYHLGKGQGERYQFISRWNSFHGTTLGSLSMTGFSAVRQGFTPWLVGFPKIVPPYCYRCPLGRVYPGCGVACAAELERAILYHGPETIAGFIAEAINGPRVAGLTPPPEYYPRVREICDRYDVLFIVDEVMTGFCRTGRSFAIDHWNVVPDIICFGKGVSGGYYPLGGFVLHEKIVDILASRRDGKFFDGYSHSGEPLACTVGLTVLKIMQEKNLVERARAMGDYARAGLAQLSEKHPTIGEVRGRGLMIGVEFVRDRALREPFPLRAGFATRLAETALEKGAFLFTAQGFIDGQAGDQLLLAPPLIISREEIDEIMVILGESLSQLEAEVV